MWSLLAVVLTVSLIVVGAARLAEATGFSASHDRGPTTRRGGSRGRRSRSDDA